MSTLRSKPGGVPRHDGRGSMTRGSICWWAAEPGRPRCCCSYFSIASRALAWSAAFYGLALFFNYPHYMATIYRAYLRRRPPEIPHLHRSHHGADSADPGGFALLAGHLPWIFTLYLTWSPWHYSGQNYGLFMMFARRAGAKPGTTERRALYGAFLVPIYSFLELSYWSLDGSALYFSGYSCETEPLGRRAGGRFPGSLGFRLVALVGQVGWQPLLPSLTLFSTQFLWFLLPTAVALPKGWRSRKAATATACWR